MKKTVFKTFVVSFFAIVVFSIVVLQILASPASSAHSNSSISSSEFLGVESFSGLTAASVSVVQESTICDGDFWAEDTNTLLTLLEESSASDYVDLARANLSVGLPTAFFFKDQNYQDDVWVFVVGEFLDEDQVDIAGNDGWGDDVHSIIFFEPTLEGANWILDIFDRKNLEPQDTVRFCSSIAIPDLDEKMYSRVADMKGDDMSSFRFLFSSEDCAPFCLVTPTPQPTPYAVQGCDDGPSSEQITLHRNINFALVDVARSGVKGHTLVF
ncbi:MAG: hypothetical protein H6644_09840 [Caldilineaceae bacterium]|nr:hypothetical protein [Caldilineaceae bacterium]